MDNIWIQIAVALMLIVMLVRMWPTAMHLLKNGPRGSSKEWLNASMLLAGVVLFVTFLMVMVRG